MNAFDEAWNILKGLSEQQMFREARPRQNAAKNLASSLAHRPLIDEYGARSYGTVHPAIASLLSRNTPNQLPNLNLDMGEKEQRLLDSIERRNFNKPFWAIGRSIARSPEDNMELYDIDYDMEQEY
jgi:hypothetical protein